MYRAGAMSELVMEMDRFRVDTCVCVCVRARVLQDIRWPGKGTVVEI
jgi:hypothetical protein